MASINPLAYRKGLSGPPQGLMANGWPPLTIQSNPRPVINGVSTNQVGKNFRVSHKIGCGSFGEIFLGVDLRTNERVAIKVENRQTKYPQLLDEYAIYRGMSRGVGVPQAIWCGSNSNVHIMVMDLLGDSLETLYNACGRKFSLKTITMLAIQLLHRIEHHHNNHFLHRDIKPDNFLLGPPLSGTSHIVHLVDMGLCKKYRDDKSLQHIPYRENKKLIGTPRYASVSTHMGVEQCFPVHNTRVLTNKGFLFLDEIQASMAAGEEVTYACFDRTAQQLVYRTGKLVLPKHTNHRIIDFTHPKEQRRWEKETDAYGMDADANESDQDEDGAVPNDAYNNNHLSLQVTHDHDMFVQMDSADLPDSHHGGNPALYSKQKAQELRYDSKHPHSSVRMLGVAANGVAVAAEASFELFVELHCTLGLDSNEAVECFLELYGWWLRDALLLMEQPTNSWHAVLFRLRHVEEVEQLCHLIRRVGLNEQEWRMNETMRDGDACSIIEITSRRWVEYFASEYINTHPSLSSSPSPLSTIDHDITSSPVSPSISPSPSLPHQTDLPHSHSPTLTAVHQEQRFFHWALSRCNQHQLRLILRGLSHPSSSSNTVTAILTHSLSFRDQLMQLCLHAGYSPHFTCVKQNDSEPVCWKVTYAEPTSTVGKHACWPSVERRSGVSETKYEGQVWCVTVDHDDHLIVAQRAERSSNGTVTKASRPVITGQCRRDDLESIGYMLIYFFAGKLPWQGLRAKNKQEKYDKIYQCKMQTSIADLCKGAPPCFRTYLEYTKSLRFTQKPDYKFLRTLFIDLFITQGWKDDCVYDWMLPQNGVIPATPSMSLAFHGSNATTLAQLSASLPQGPPFHIFHHGTPGSAQQRAIVAAAVSTPQGTPQQSRAVTPISQQQTMHQAWANQVQKQQQQQQQQLGTPQSSQPYSTARAHTPVAAKAVTATAAAVVGTPSSQQQHQQQQLIQQQELTIKDLRARCASYELKLNKHEAAMNSYKTELALTKARCDASQTRVRALETELRTTKQNSVYYERRWRAAEGENLNNIKLKDQMMMQNEELQRQVQTLHQQLHEAQQQVQNPNAIPLSSAGALKRRRTTLATSSSPTPTPTTSGTTPNEADEDEPAVKKGRGRR